MASDDIDDAAPLEAVKWSFVRRRVTSLLVAHGHHEVAPPPLELRGTHLLARRQAAWPVGDDLELRADPMLSLAQLYARARRANGAAAAPLVRWMLCDVVFDPSASGPHSPPAWHVIAGAIFGVDGVGPELEAALLLQRIGSDLGLSKPALRVSFDGLTLPVARALRRGLADLGLGYSEATTSGASIELWAQPADGAPLLVAWARRHDGLLAALGEAPAPLFGVEVSVRRAASCAPGGAELYEPAAEVFFVVTEQAAQKRALLAAVRERGRGLRVEVELRPLPREPQLTRAAAIRARAIVEFGADGERVRLKLAGEADARDVPLDDLSSALRRLLR